jgi:hypothetical protein
VAALTLAARVAATRMLLVMQHPGPSAAEMPDQRIDVELPLLLYIQRALLIVRLCSLRRRDGRVKWLHPMEVASTTGHRSMQMLKRYAHLKSESILEKLG